MKIGKIQKKQNERWMNERDNSVQKSFFKNKRKKRTILIHLNETILLVFLLNEQILRTILENNRFLLNERFFKHTFFKNNNFFH